MRVVAVTQIWPNSVEPLSSPFNLQQFKELATMCDLTVLAAVAYAPGLHRLPRSIWGGEAPRPVQLHALPAREVIHGIETEYMRQVYLPKVGVPVAVPLYLASLAPHRARLAEADVILGTWAYPDGCAAILAAKMLEKPCAVKVHGSDLNVIAKRPSARAVLRRVLPKADAMVGVSTQLNDEIADLGVPRARIHLVANGVNTSLFAPRDRGEMRRALGVREDAELLVFVGRLEPQKGIDELLAAFPRVRAQRPKAVLAMIGDGVSRAKVAEAVARSEGSMLAPGARPLAEVARWVGAASAFTLPSWMEGTPNVVLEALASGRPVVATSVGGIPDVMSDPRSGVLVPAKDADALARGLTEVLARLEAGEFTPDSVKACGPRSWRESAQALHDVLLEAKRAHHGAK